MRHLVALLLLPATLIAPFVASARPLSHSKQSSASARQRAAVTAVTVTNGSYDGPTASGSSLDIWANPAATAPNAGMVFDHWTGDIEYLDNPFAVHAVMTVPSIPVSVTAVFKGAAAWTPTTLTIGYDDSTTPPTPIDYEYVFPGPSSSLKGLIFRFHGTGGSAYDGFNAPEDMKFDVDAIAAGFAIATLDRSDRVTAQWNTNFTIATNPDLQNVQSVLNSFLASGFIAATTPVFTEGMSNGGPMSTLAAFQMGADTGNTTPPTPSFNVLGTALYCADGAPMVATLTTVPTCWNLAGDDTVFTGNANAAMYRSYLTARGVRTAYYIHQPQPCDPLRFWSATLDQTQSMAIYSALKTAGILDANDYVASDPESSAALTKIANALPTKYQSAANGVQPELNVYYTEHNFYADRDDFTLDFFLSLARIAGIVNHPGCENLAQPMTIQRRPTTASASTVDVTLDSNDDSFLEGIRPCSYQLAVKGYKRLQNDVDSDATSGLGATVIATLPPGDANDDNLVDISDFSILASAFGTSTGDPAFNVDADFSCDGVIDITDFGLLADSFGSSGDPWCPVRHVVRCRNRYRSRRYGSLARVRSRDGPSSSWRGQTSRDLRR